MDNFKIYFTLLIGLLFTSCIPTKDLIYLQENNDKSSVNQSVELVNQKPYRLQVNDILNISIKALDSRLVEIFRVNDQVSGAVNEQTAYFNGYHVDDHGNIRIPVLKEVNVLGRTLEETRIIIEQRLNNEYFTNEAGVFVVVKLAGFRYVVNGEVNSSGTKIIYQDKVNILEAIANAGDITITGDRKDVIVMRKFPHGTETYHLDLTDVNAMKSQAYNLQPNDYIYVKPLKQKTWGTGKTGLESLSTIITLLSLATTTFLLLRN